MSYLSWNLVCFFVQKKHPVASSVILNNHQDILNYVWKNFTDDLSKRTSDRNTHAAFAADTFQSKWYTYFFLFISNQNYSDSIS
jgi:hypothetical protein